MDPLPLSLRRFSDHRLLTPKEEISLGKAVQGKNSKKAKAAVDQLIEHNLKLVIKIAGDYCHPGLEIDDLISEGSIGLQKAAIRFDPSHGAKFSTYAAWWIKQSIQRYLSNNGRTIRVPNHMLDTLRKLQRVRDQLAKELEREPTDEEVSEMTGISEKKLVDLHRYNVKTISLDTPLSHEGEKGETTVGDIIPDEQTLAPDIVAQRHIESARVESILEELTLRERQVIILRYGLKGENPQTLEQIGKRYKVTRERIRQIQNIVLRKLRRRISKQSLNHLPENPPSLHDSNSHPSTRTKPGHSGRMRARILRRNQTPNGTKGIGLRNHRDRSPAPGQKIIAAVREKAQRTDRGIDKAPHAGQQKPVPGVYRLAKRIEKTLNLSEEQIGDKLLEIAQACRPLLKRSLQGRRKIWKKELRKLQVPEKNPCKRKPETARKQNKP